MKGCIEKNWQAGIKREFYVDVEKERFVSSEKHAEWEEKMTVATVKDIVTGVLRGMRFAVFKWIYGYLCDVTFVWFHNGGTLHTLRGGYTEATLLLDYQTR